MSVKVEIAIPCEYCPETFTSISALNKHTGENHQKCDQCNKSFTFWTMKQFKAHLKSHIKKPPKPKPKPKSKIELEIEKHNPILTQKSKKVNQNVKSTKHTHPHTHEQHKMHHNRQT